MGAKIYLQVEQNSEPMAELVSRGDVTQAVVQWGS